MSKVGLRAFAAGIMITTIIFSLIFYTKTGTFDSSKNEFTEKEFKIYLQHNDLIAVSKEKYEQFLSFENQELERSKSTQNNSKVTNDQPQNDSATKNEEPSQDSVVEDGKKTITSYKLVVKDGMDSLQVSNLLQQAAIINDAEVFNTYLMKEKLNRSIQIGTYELTSRMSFEKLANIITNND